MTRDEQAKYLATIDALLPRLSIDWRRRTAEEGDRVEVRLIAGQPFTPLLTFDPHADAADIDAVCNLPEMLKFLRELVRQWAERYRRDRPELKPEHTQARDCAIHCGRADFQRFLHEIHGLALPATKEAVKTKIHSALAIKSRTELDESPAAAKAWADMRAHFYSWRKQG